MRRTATITALAMLIFALPAPAQLHDKDRPGEMESARLEDLARQAALRLAGYQPREDGESEDGGLTPEQRSKITLHVDENGMVIIRGTQDDISRFDFIYGLVLEKMRQVGPPKPDIRKYKCVHIDVTVAAALLDDIFNGPQKARQRVAAQQRGRQQQQRGRQPQRGRQQQAEPEPEPEPESSGAARGLERLADLFGVGEGKAADPTELMGIQVVPEKRTNYLFIMAKTELFPQIIDTLHTIDVETERDPRESDIVVLQRLNADEVKAMLEELLGITDARRAQQAGAAARARRAGAQRRGRGQQGQAAAQLAEQIEDEMMQIGVGGQQFKLSDIKISSLTATNTIIVFGPEEARKSIVKIIKDLDEQGPDPRVVAIPLEFAEAEPLAEALQDSYGGSGRDRESNINISAEASSNTIYLTAPENVRGEIIRQIMQAEAKATNVKTPRTIQILQGDVESIAAALELVFKDRKGRKKVTIVPDETSNQLIIKAPDDIYKEIAALVSKMDKKGMQIVPKFYKLQHAYAPELEKQFDEMVKELAFTGDRTGRPAPNVGAFGVTSDPATNSLIVMGTPMIFAILDTVVAKIDVEHKDSVRMIKTISLANNDANEVANNVNRLFGDPKRQREGMDPPRAEPNRSTNAVVVAGTARQVEEIEKFINDLEAIAAPGEKGEVLPYIIALEHISADTAAETLTNIFTQRFEAIEQSGQKVKDAEKTVTITPDFITNQLFVNATESNKAVIDEIVAMIDKEGAGIADVRSSEVFHLIYADPNSTAAAINKTFQKRGGRVPEKDQVTAAVDRGTKAVVVTASRRNLEKVRNIIEQLDVKPEEFAGRYAAVYSIRHADLTALRSAVNQAFNIPGARPEERVTAAADVPTGSLIVTANAERHGQISKLLEELDQEKDTSRKFHTVKLTSGDATEAARTLQQLINEQTRGRRGQVKPTVVASAATNSLMIYASDSELAQFRPLIDAMDEEDSVAGEPQRIALVHQNAAQMVDLLTRMFTEPAREKQRRGGRRGGTQKLVPLIISDDATNTLIVRAQQHDFDQIKKMVARLDEDTGDGLTGTRIITLAEGMDVAAMAEDIELLIREGERHIKSMNPSYKPKNVSIMADARTSSLILSGASAQFDEVEKIVRELEGKGPVGPTSIRVIKLNTIRSGDVKKVLDQLIEQRNRSRGRRRR